MITLQRAIELGYRIKAASAFEVGLIKDNQGIRTWWASEFGGQLPRLDHPKIQEAIEISENIWTKAEDL